MRMKKKRFSVYLHLWSYNLKIVYYSVKIVGQEVRFLLSLPSRVFFNVSAHVYETFMFTIYNDVNYKL